MSTYTKEVVREEIISTLGCMVKPCPETGTLDEDQFCQGKIMKQF